MDFPSCFSCGLTWWEWVHALTLCGVKTNMGSDKTNTQHWQTGICSTSVGVNLKYLNSCISINQYMFFLRKCADWTFFFFGNFLPVLIQTQVSWSFTHPNALHKRYSPVFSLIQGEVTRTVSPHPHTCWFTPGPAVFTLQEVLIHAAWIKCCSLKSTRAAATVCHSHTRVHTTAAAIGWTPTRPLLIGPQLTRDYEMWRNIVFPIKLYN